MSASEVLAAWGPELIAPIAGVVVSSVAAAVGVMTYRHNSGQRRRDRRERRIREQATAESVLQPPFGMLETTIHGRDDFVDDLSRLWERRLWPRRGTGQARLRVLHGIGGAGKTTVALIVARDALRRDVRVWWVSGATTQELHTGLRALSRHLGASDAEVRDAWKGSGDVPERAPGETAAQWPGDAAGGAARADGAGPTSTAADLLWRLLRAHRKPWLLIIDNADDLRVLALAPETSPTTGTGWLRPGTPPRGAMLITTRTRDPRVWDRLAWCRAKPVDMLSDVDGAAVLRELTDGRAGGAADAERLARRLGGLPLALRLAGRYLLTTNDVPLGNAVTTYAAYLAELERSGPVSLMSASDGVDPPPDRRAIDRTWQLSLRLLEARGHTAARPMLRVLAMMADAAIPYPLILDASIVGSSKAFKGCDVRDLLLALDSLALIDLTPGGEHDSPALRLHLMIRDTTRHDLALNRGAETGTARLAIRLIARAVNAPEASNPDDPRCWPAWRGLAPHAQSLFATARALPGLPGDALTAAADSAAAAARYLAAIGLFDAAQQQVDDVVAVYERLLGPHDPRTLDARCNAARWIGEAGDRAAARDEFRTLVEECERVHGTEAAVTLGLRGHLAHWTGWAGDAATARDLCAALLPLRRKHLGARHPDTFSLRSGLAHWTGLSGDAGWARDEYAALVALTAAVCGPEDPATLHALSGQARWTGEAGEPAKARDLYLRLVPVIARVCGPEHHNTLNELAHLAHWTGEAGDPASAVEQYRALLPVRERVCGPAHPETAESRASLAHWQRRAGAPARTSVPR